MKIRYMKDKVKRHLNLKSEEIPIPFLYYHHFIFMLNFHICFFLIENCIIYSLRNIKAIKTVILKMLKT